MNYSAVEKVASAYNAAMEKEAIRAPSGKMEILLKARKLAKKSPAVVAKALEKKSSFEDIKLAHLEELLKAGQALPPELHAKMLEGISAAREGASKAISHGKKLKKGHTLTAFNPDPRRWVRDRPISVR